MATVSITIPAALVPRAKAAGHALYDNILYPAAMPNGVVYQSNPIAGMTDTQAFQWISAEYWRNVIIEYESQIAAAASRAQIAADVSAIQ
jgi:hypothetical protein